MNNKQGDKTNNNLREVKGLLELDPCVMLFNYSGRLNQMI